MSKEIALKPYKHGKVALVSDRDYEWLSKYDWELVTKEDGALYAMHVDWNGGDRIRIYMHRLITNCPDDMEVDHENRDGLDNRRENLRICTGLQNNANKKARSDSDSGYKGIEWDAVRNRWLSKVKCNGERATGRFRTLKEAIDFYNENAAKFFGEFAWLNVYDANDEKPISFEDRRKYNGGIGKNASSSKYKGVYYDKGADAGKNGKRWRATFYNKGKIFLGRFATEREAAVAWNKAAIEHFGDQAELNDVS